VKGLELGPGSSPIKGFVSMDIVERKGVDYVGDVSKRLPFSDGSFDVVYASHVLEHIAWYDVPRILKDWVRVVCPGGVLEIWVPDGRKICAALLKHENDAQLHGKVPDKWLRRNPKADPCVWANGRLFYGDSGQGDAREASFHRSMFTPRYLKQVLVDAGLKDVRPLKKPRGVDHGWINLGMTGTKA
jgi:ubiquinone/menaquinone biosynthesis C-methylase UbiE